MNLSLTILHDDEHRDTAIVWCQAQVNDHREDFVLDTGCSRTSLKYSEQFASLTKVGEEHYRSAMGEAKSDLVHLDSFSLGNLNKTDLTVNRFHQGGNQKSLLGMDILKDFCLEFCFRDQALRTLSTEVQGEQVITFDKGHIPIISVKLDHQVFDAVWDSGAGITLVDKGFYSANKKYFTPAGETEGMDSSGSQLMTSVFIMSHLTIDGRLLPPHRVVVVDLSSISKATGREIAFILGYSTLKMGKWLMNFPQAQWQVFEWYT